MSLTAKGPCDRWGLTERDARWWFEGEYTLKMSCGDRVERVDERLYDQRQPLDASTRCRWMKASSDSKNDRLKEQGRNEELAFESNIEWTPPPPYRLENERSKSLLSEGLTRTMSGYLGYGLYTAFGVWNAVLAIIPEISGGQAISH